MNLLISDGMGGGVYCGEIREMVIAPDKTPDVSTKTALLYAVKRVHPEHGSIEGTQIFSLEDCCNPICLRLKQLAEQL